MEFIPKLATLPFEQLPRRLRVWFAVGLACLVPALMGVLIFVLIDRQRIEERSQDQTVQHENDVRALQECKRESARALDNARKEYQAQIDDLKSLMASIQRGMGGKSVWDLSTVTITPDQAKTLGPQYVYQSDIHCYLFLPASGSCSFLATTEDGMWRMMHPNSPSPISLIPSKEAEALLELGKALKVHLWRWPTSFVLHLVSPTEPTICLFPYISIEEVSHDVAAKTMFPLLSKFTEHVAAYIQTPFAALDIWADSVNETLNQTSASDRLPPLILPRFPHNSPEEIREIGEEFVRSFVPDLTTDSAAFVWASRAILTEFKRTQNVSQASFQLRSAEKQGKVFHLSVRCIFPASDTTPEIYWDQELIFITTGRATFVVTISTPWSLQQRFTEESWISGWLAGVKIPCG
jgi:hypothetical protein